MSRVPPETLSFREVADEIRADIAENLAAIDILFMRSIGIEPATAVWIEKERRRRIAALERALIYFDGFAALGRGEHLSVIATKGRNE